MINSRIREAIKMAGTEVPMQAAGVSSGITEADDNARERENKEKRGAGHRPAMSDHGGCPFDCCRILISTNSAGLSGAKPISILTTPLSISS